MTELKKRFDDFTSPNFYSRVSTDHVLELYIGLDEKGRKSIELRSAFNPRKVKGTSAIEVNQYGRRTTTVSRIITKGVTRNETVYYGISV